MNYKIPFAAWIVSSVIVLQGCPEQEYVYPDFDGDSFGDPNFPYPSQGLEPLPGFVFDNTDCNDFDAGINPGADDVPGDMIDSDCDGFDGDVVTSTWYADSDTDGFGNPSESIEAAEMPAGYVADNTDCDDSNSATFPGAEEVFDSLDNNCDGAVDEGFTLLTWYQDADGDGFGNAGISIVDITQPAGYVSDDSDCNDNSASTFPGAEELADGEDNDCNGLIDDGVCEPQPGSPGYVEIEYDLNQTRYTISNTDGGNGDGSWIVGPGTITLRYQDDGAGNPLNNGTAEVVYMNMTQATETSIFGVTVFNIGVVTIPDNRWDGVTGSELVAGSAVGTLNGDAISFDGGLTDYRTAGDISCEGSALICGFVPTGPVETVTTATLETINLSSSAPNLESNMMVVADSPDAFVETMLRGNVTGNKTVVPGDEGSTCQ